MTSRSPKGSSGDSTGDATFFRGAAAGVSGQIVALAAGFLAAVLVARSTEVGELGAYAVAAAITTFISLLTGLQLQAQVARAHTDTEAAGLLPWAIAAGALGSLTAAGLAGAAHLWPSFSVGPLIWLTPAIAMQPSIDALSGLLAHDGKAGWMVLQQVVRASSRPAIVLMLVAVLGSLDSQTIAIVDSAVALVSLVAFVMIHGGGVLRRRLSHRDKVRLATLLPAFGAFLIAAANWQVIQRADLLCVGFFLGHAPAGRYAVALRLLEGATSFFGALMVFYLPLATRARREGRGRDAYVRATVLGAQILLPGLVFIGVWGDRISAELFGAQYSLPVKVFVALAVGLIAQVAAGPNGLVLTAGRRHGQIAGIAGVVFVLNLVLNLLLVPTLGVMGAATASTVSFIVLNVAEGLAIRQEVGPIRWNNTVVVWELCYLVTLAASVAAPRLFFGPDAIAFVSSAALGLFLFGLSARSRLVRPVMASLFLSLRRAE